MKKITKALSLSIASISLLFGYLVSSKSSNAGFGQECNHNGYHYNKVESTPYVNGTKEFWSCCLCRETYYDCQTPNGTWQDREVSKATGGLSSDLKLERTYEIINPVTVDVTGCVTENSSNINSANGYSMSTKINGVWVNGYRKLADVILDKYSEIKFSFLTEGSSTSYFEVYSRNLNNINYVSSYASRDTTWIEVNIKKENNVYNLYVNGTKTTCSINPFSFLSDFVRVQLANNSIFYVSEMLGYIDLEAYQSIKVSNKVVADSTFDNDNQTSSLTIDAHHKIYPFSNVDISSYSYLYFYLTPSVNCYFFLTADSTARDISIKINKSHLVELVRTSSNWNVYYDGSLMTDYQNNNPRENLNLLDNLSNLKFMANADAKGHPFTFSPLFTSSNALSINGESAYTISYFEDESNLYSDFAVEMQNIIKDSTGATLPIKQLNKSDFLEKTIVNSNPLNVSSTTIKDATYVHKDFSYSNKITLSWVKTYNALFKNVNESLYDKLSFYVMGGNPSSGSWFEIKDFSCNLYYSFDGVFNSTWHKFDFIKSNGQWDLYVNDVLKAKSLSSIQDVYFALNGTYYFTPLYTYVNSDLVVDNNQYQIVLGKALIEAKGFSTCELGDKNFSIKYYMNTIYIFGDSCYGTYLGIGYFLKQYLGYAYYQPQVFDLISNVSHVPLTKSDYTSSNYFDNEFNVDGNLRNGGDYISYNRHIGTAYNYSDNSLIYSMHNEHLFANSKYYPNTTPIQNEHINLKDSNNVLGVTNYLYDEHVLNGKRTKLCFALDDNSTWYDSTDASEYSNIYWSFMNQVASELDKLVNYDITLYGLAYNQTVKTPSNSFSFYRGNHVNLSVWYAPVQAIWSDPINSASNKLSTFTCGYGSSEKYSPYTEYINWSNLCTDGIKMGLFSYSTFVDSYFVPINWINSLQENYQFAYEHNTGFIYDMGQYDNSVETDWASLKIYLKSQYFKSPYANQDELITNYFNAYFGKAANKMKEALTDEIAILRAVSTSKGTSTINLAFGSLHAGKVCAQCYYWNQTTLTNLINKFNDAKNLVSGNQTIINRITLESLPLRYVYVRCCTNNYSTGRGFWTNKLGDTFGIITNEAIRLGVSKMGEGSSFGILN